ncbi:MAG: IPT/TIG domain-containing protein [Deltaproteobacteria bacterium]|nr:IPT/TIG domain-containing protein [Deltaproteobacteria bacterium]
MLLRPRHLRSSFAWLPLALALAGCPDPPAEGESDAGPRGPIIGFIDAGPSTGPDDPDGGPDLPINETTILESVTPPTGPMEGPIQEGLRRVLLTGSGFTPEASDACPDCNLQVFFGGIESASPLFLNDRNISADVPPCPAAGPVEVKVVTSVGIGLLEGGFTCFSPVTLEGLAPGVGSTEGGTSVTITGQGFTSTMIVLVGGRQAVGLSVDAGGSSATFLTPPGAGPGRVDVVGVDTFGRSTLELAFTYESPLALAAVSPNIVDDTNAIVELTGSGFYGQAPVAVTIGGVAAALDNVITDARMRVVVPSGLSGAVDLEATRGAEVARLDDALVVRPALTGTLTVSAALPARIDVAGGALTLVGEGFAAGGGVAGVTVAGAPASDVVVVDDRTLTLTAPAGVAGAAPIVVTRVDAANATLNGVLYFEPVVVTAVAPSSGDAAGGTVVTVSGRGFSGASALSFGGTAATDLVVLSDTELTATTPAGAAGPVAVRVERGAERGLLVDGFRYDAPLSLLGVLPARGGIGGNTFVVVTGSGFTKGAPALAFDGRAATEVTVLSDSVLTARTPSGVPGLIDVEVTLGAESALADRSFTYFNPTSIAGGARGGPIEGAVYVSAMDAMTGFPIPNLIAWVGTDGTPVAAGVTDLLGQATISGPEVMGPQTVSVSGYGYSQATFIDVDAAELSVFLFPLIGSPPQPGRGPPPPPPATIRGRVFGFAKEFFDPAALDQSGCNSGPPLPCEIAFAEVRTTARDEFSGNLPAGGENVVLEEGGEYYIANSRTGRLALVALAGIFDVNNDTFRLRQLGVRREVFPQWGVDLIDQDIELTIPLDEEIEVSLPDAPLRADPPLVDFSLIGARPTITRVVPALQFGGEGAYVYTQAIEGVRNHAVEEMPDVTGNMLTFIAGAYTTDGRNLYTEQGSVALVEGSREVTGTGTSDWGYIPFGSTTPEVVGKAFVTIRPDGGRFASVILGSPDSNTLQLQDAADFSASGRAYHIGDFGLPSSEVVQDGVGDLRGGVTIQPVLGLPEVLSPLEGAALTDRTLRWKAPVGQLPSIHDMFVYDALAFSYVVEVYVDGARTKVILPRPPAKDEVLAVLPHSQHHLVDNEDFVDVPDLSRGGMAWQHESIYVPGLSFNNWSLLDTGSRGRRAWTTDVHTFVSGD